MTTMTTTKRTKRLASTAVVMKARLRRLWCRSVSSAGCTGRGGRVVEPASSYGSSGHDADADAYSQFGIGGGTASSTGSDRTATFGVTIGSGAHTGSGGSGALRLGDRVAETDVLAGRRSAAAGLAPSVSGVGVLSALRFVLVGFEALSSLSGVVVSAVGIPQYGVRHTRWKVPRPSAQANPHGGPQELGVRRSCSRVLRVVCS
jgi:hypothetical protein